MSKAEYIEKLKTNPLNAKLYLDLALMLKAPDETVELFKIENSPIPPVVMTQQQLYMKAIELNRTLAIAYLALKNQLEEDDDTIRLNDGRDLNSRQLILEAIHYAPHEPLPYSALAFLTEVGEKAELLDGRKMNRNQLLLEAVHLDRNVPLLAYRKQYEVDPESKVPLPDKRELTQAQLVKAIVINPFDYLAMAGLILTMAPGSKIFIPNTLLPSINGKPVPGKYKKRDELGKQAITIAAAGIGPLFAYPFFVLALTMNPGDKINTGIPLLGETDLLGLVLKAIEKSPLEPQYYLFAGLWLKPGERTMLGTMNQVSLLQKVLKMDPNNAMAHIGLGYSIGADETVKVGDIKLSRQQLFLRAAQLDPELPIVYLCLALSLEPGQEEPITVNGKEMKEADLFGTYNTLNAG